MASNTQHVVADPGLSGHPTIIGARGGVYERAIPQGDALAQITFQQEPMVTAMVIGQPRLQVPFGEQLFRPVTVPHVVFQWVKYGKEGMSPKETRRAFSAPIQYSDRRRDSEPDKLERHSWRTRIDVDELNIARQTEQILGVPGLSLQEIYARDARLIVDMSLEQERSALVLAAASYSQSAPDLDVTLAAGSEFNDPTNGDSRTVVRALAQTIAAANGISLEQIEAFATFESFHAAQDDPLFITRRTGGARTQGDRPPSAAEIAEYWGIKSLTVGDGFVSTDGVTVTSLYGDIVVLRVSSDLIGYDVSEGRLDSFVDFVPAQGMFGQALVPFYEDAETTWNFPWQRWIRSRLVTTTSAGIIRNCAA